MMRWSFGHIVTFPWDKISYSKYSRRLLAIETLNWSESTEAIASQENQTIRSNAIAPVWSDPRKGTGSKQQYW
jgi:hypothetical protein